MAQQEEESMLYCPKCQQLEATTPQKHDDGTVTYLCRKCGGAIPLRRDLRPGEVVPGGDLLRSKAKECLKQLQRQVKD